MFQFLIKYLHVLLTWRKKLTIVWRKKVSLFRSEGEFFIFSSFFYFDRTNFEFFSPKTNFTLTHYLVIFFHWILVSAVYKPHNYLILCQSHFIWSACSQTKIRDIFVYRYLLLLAVNEVLQLDIQASSNWLFSGC